MPRPYKPLIPQSIGEVMDHLAMMMLSAPTMEDKLGTFTRNLDSVCFELREGLEVVKFDLGRQRYDDLVAMSGRMRRAFEADPEDTNGKAREGRAVIRKMRDVLAGK